MGKALSTEINAQDNQSYLLCLQTVVQTSASCILNVGALAAAASGHRLKHWGHTPGTTLTLTLALTLNP